MLTSLLGEFRRTLGVGVLPHDPPEITPSGLPFGREVAAADHFGLNVGGSTPNYRVRIGGADYFVKELPHPPDPSRELLARELAKIAGVRSVACRAVWVRHRTMALVYEWFDGDSFEVLSWEGEDVVARARALPPEEVARLVLFGFLVGHTDSHLGNFMLGRDGALLGIDYEQILGRNRMARGYTLAGYHRLLRAHVGHVHVGPMRPGDAEAGLPAAAAFPLPHRLIARTAAAADAGAVFLADLGRYDEAKFVRRRGRVLCELGALANPTVGDLDRPKPTPPGE